MKKLNDLKIGVRLSIVMGSVIVLIFSVLGIYIYIIQRDKIYADMDVNMTEQVNDLCKLVQLQIK